MTASPVFMIRRGDFKYVRCADDPAQLYNIAEDPRELHNLAGDPAYADTEAEFAADVSSRWDSAALRADVIANQKSRRAVFEAMQHGVRTDWDHNPQRDAFEEHVRNHIDWIGAAQKTRFPPPAKS